MKALFVSLLTLFIFYGCGGGESYSKIEDAITPTANLQKNQSKELVSSIIQSNFLKPTELLNDFGTSNKLKKVSKPFASTSQNKEYCSDGGFKETIKLSGNSEVNYYETNKTSGNSVVEVIYHDCKKNPTISLNGVEKISEKWSLHKPILTYDLIYQSSQMTYQKDTTHKVTISYILHNKGEVSLFNGMQNDNNQSQANINKGSSFLQYDATFVNGKETLQFKNIKREKIFDDETTNDTHKRYLSFKLSGAIYSSKLNGWIVLETPMAFEANENDEIDNQLCFHQGKLLIKGANHTITLEVLQNHNILIKFDEKIVQQYDHCTQFKEEL